MAHDKQLRWIDRLLSLRWALSVALLAFLPFSLSAAWQSWLSNSNNVEDWLPADPQLIEFVQLFGSDELLMISWEGCSLDDPRLESYAAALLEPAEEKEPYFRDAITGSEVLQLFQNEPLEMEREEALQRMQGWLASRDGETTCLVALVSTAGAMDRRAAVDHARRATEAVEGLQADQLKLAGPTIEGVAIDDASKSGLLELNLASYAVCLTVLVVCLRHLRAAMLVFLLALFNEQLSLALIHWLGSNLDSILLLTANLTFVLSISIGVHLVNYYRDALAMTETRDAAAESLRVALRPSFVATATTALGLVSLGISEVLPLSRFGLYSALSILVGTVVVMVFTPIHFRIWPMRRSSASTNEASSLQPGSVGSWTESLGHIARPLLLVVIGVIVCGVFGIRQLKTAVGLHELVSPRMRSSQDFVWLEETIGPLVPVEMVVELPSGDARELLAQFRVVERLHKELEKLDPAFTVLSSATLSPEPPPEGGGFRQLAQAAAFRQQLLQNQEQLANLGYLDAQQQSNFWRLTLRAPSMQDVDYGAVLAEAQDIVDQTLATQEAVEPKRVLVCGGIPLIYNVQQQLLDDLIESFLLAFSLVSLALMILFRSVWCGLVCMIPNLLPSAIVFGLMGWLGWSVEVGTVLTASAALGIAVDDSLHFITWFQRALERGRSNAEAVASAYRRCGAAMIQTTLVCGLGLVVFAGSGFSPIARFGWCMFALLFLALVADLIVLPAILLSPLGRLFVPRSHSSSVEQQSTQSSTSFSKASVFLVLIGFTLFAVPARAEIPPQESDQLAAALPPAVLAAIYVDDFPQAVATYGESLADDAKQPWGDFAELFGIRPRELAAISAGPLLRATVLQEQEAEIVIAKLTDEAPAELPGKRHESYLILSKENAAVDQTIERLQQPTLEKEPWWRRLKLDEVESTGVDLQLRWFSAPWLKEETLLAKNANRKPSKEFRRAQRHGLTAIKSVVGEARYQASELVESQALSNAPPPWQSSLKMFESLKPLEKLALEPWVPEDVQSVTLLALDLPQAFGQIDAIFEDGFLGESEGAYQGLLGDIRQILNVNLKQDLYAKFGSKAYVIRGHQQQGRAAPLLIAVETIDRGGAAKVLHALMKDDPFAKQIEVGDHEFTMHFVPAQNNKGADLVMMVAYGYVFYTDSEPLMRKVLDPSQPHPLSQEQSLKKIFKQIDGKNAEQPSLIIVSDYSSKHAGKQKRKRTGLLDVLFLGSEATLDGRLQDFQAGSDGASVSVGFQVPEGLKLISK